MVELRSVLALPRTPPVRVLLPSLAASISLLSGLSILAVVLSLLASFDNVDIHINKTTRRAATRTRRGATFARVSTTRFYCAAHLATHRVPYVLLLRATTALTNLPFTVLTSHLLQNNTTSCYLFYYPPVYSFILHYLLCIHSYNTCPACMPALPSSLLLSWRTATALLRPFQPRCPALTARQRVHHAFSATLPAFSIAVPSPVAARAPPRLSVSVLLPRSTATMSLCPCSAFLSDSRGGVMRQPDI